MFRAIAGAYFHHIALRGMSVADAKLLSEYFTSRSNFQLKLKRDVNLLRQ